MSNDNNKTKNNTIVTSTISNVGAGTDAAWSKFISDQSDDIGKISKGVLSKAFKPVGAINDINSYTIAKTDKEKFKFTSKNVKNNLRYI